MTFAITQCLISTLLVTSSAAGSSNATNAAGYVIENIKVNDQILNKSSSDKDQLVTDSHAKLTFQIANRSQREDLSFRYKLEGYDSSWKSIGDLYTLIRVMDKDDRSITKMFRTVRNQSKGWNGNPTQSPLVTQEVTLALPAEADRLRIQFATKDNSWPDAAAYIGSYVFSNLQVTLTPAASPSNQVVLKPNLMELLTPQVDELARETAQNHEKTTVQSGSWRRLDVRSAQEYCRILQGPDNASRLMIWDNSPHILPTWTSIGSRQFIKVKGMSKMKLTWEEGYSVGRHGDTDINYERLPEGSYIMRIQAVSPDGQPVGAESSFPIKVSSPFHKTWTFLLLCLLGSGTIIGLIVRQVTQMRLLKRVHALEKMQMLEHERHRIARDLHDHMGADLTHLAQLSDLALSISGGQEQIRARLDEVFDLAKNLSQQTDEIVWSVNPVNDTLESFLSYMTNLAQRRFDTAGISCRLDIPQSTPSLPLSSQKRHHLLMACKEAVNNILKHSRARHAWIRVAYDSNLLQIKIEDDGRGLCSTDNQNSPTNDGCGCINIRERMREIGGTASLNDRPGGGACITLSLPMNDTHTLSSNDYQSSHR